MSVLVRLGRGWRPCLPGCREGGRRTFRQKAREVKVKEGARVELGEAEVAPAGWSALLRPAAFAATFSCAALAGCAVWQYERMRAAALRSKGAPWGPWGRRQKAGRWREELRMWWEGLSDGERLFWPVAGANVLVLGCWRVAGLQGVMFRWFLSSPATKPTCLPMLLSTFSHHSALHLTFNMVALHSFLPAVVHQFGVEQTLGVYLAGGVLANLSSMAFKVAVGGTAGSLGASGAVLAMVGMFATIHPTAAMQVVFLPVFTFTAASGLKGLVALDTLGLLLRWRVLDHAAHLGGVAVGVGWCYLGHLLWERRVGLVTAWHSYREGR